MLTILIIIYSDYLSYKKRRVQSFYKIKATILNTKTTIKRIPIHLMHLNVNLIAK